MTCTGEGGGLGWVGGWGKAGGLSNANAAQLLAAQPLSAGLRSGV